MERTLASLLIAASLAAPHVGAWAQEGEREQYVSDEVGLTIRTEARNDAASIGTANSGAKVTVLETLGEKSFARIRTADGRVGWVTARFLTGQPAAKDRLKEMQAQLNESRDRIKSLQGELETAQSQLAQAKPAMEMAADNDRLRAEVAQAREQYQTATVAGEQERARRRTLIMGAGLVFGGIVLGLLLPFLGAVRRRRRSDF